MQTEQKNKFRLTEGSYYSKTANEIFMSASQFKSFRKCQACALAELRGEYVQPKTTALLVGSYVDAAFEGPHAFEEFCMKNPDIFKKDGNLKSEFAKALDIIERVHNQPFMMECLSGEKQKIMTGEIAGVRFKIKIDSYRPGIMIADLKCMKDFDDIYIEEQGRVPWYQGWGYDVQGAIYREIVRQNTGEVLPFVIVGVTKEPVSDMDVIEIPSEYLDYELERVKKEAPLYAALKSGLFEPERCGACNYCKSTKVIKGVRNPESEEDFFN